MSHFCSFRYTYEISPVFLLVEEAVLKKMIEYIGWEGGDGIFNPGMIFLNVKKYDIVCITTI